MHTKKILRKENANKINGKAKINWFLKEKLIFRRIFEYIQKLQIDIGRDKYWHHS